jgi:hypothetical protein
MSSKVHHSVFYICEICADVLNNWPGERLRHYLGTFEKGSVMYDRIYCVLNLPLPPDLPASTNYCQNCWAEAGLPVEKQPWDSSHTAGNKDVLGHLWLISIQRDRCIVCPGYILPSCLFIISSERWKVIYRTTGSLNRYRVSNWEYMLVLN